MFVAGFLCYDISMSVGDATNSRDRTGDNSFTFRSENIEKAQHTDFFVKIQDAKRKNAIWRTRFFEFLTSITKKITEVKRRFASMPKARKVFLFFFIVSLAASITGGAVLILNNNSTQQKNETGVKINNSLMTEEEFSEFNNYEQVRSIAFDKGVYSADKTFEEKMKLFQDLLDEYSENDKLGFYLKIRYAEFFIEEGDDSDGALRIMQTIEEVNLNNAQLDYYYAEYIDIYSLLGNSDQVETYKNKRISARKIVLPGDAESAP